MGIGQVELEGPFYVQTGPLAGAPTLLDLQATEATVVGGIGLQYRLTPNTTLGIAYTEESRFVFEGTTRATLFTPLGPIGSDFDTQVDLVWPRSVGVGLMHKLCDCRRVGADVIWYDWSHAFDRLDLVFSNPSNPIVGAVVPGGTIRDQPGDELGRFGIAAAGLRMGFKRLCDVASGLRLSRQPGAGRDTQSVPGRRARARI